MKQTLAHTLKRGERGKKEGRVNVRLPGDHQHWLRRVSGARKVTVGVIVRELIEAAYNKRHAK
jgi:hypothetical protein